MNMLRLSLPALAVVVIGLLIAGCEEPIEPYFDNIRDPYGATFIPPAPMMSLTRLDSVTVSGAVAADDRYVTSLIVERRVGSDSTFKRITTLTGPAGYFTDSDNIKAGTRYYYRSMAVGPNGRTSSYSPIFSIFM